MLSINIVSVQVTRLSDKNCYEKDFFCMDKWRICLWYPVTSYVSNPSKPATFITNLWNELPADMSQREFPYQTSSMNLTVQGCVSCLRVLPCRTFATAATECPLGLGWGLQEHFNYMGVYQNGSHLHLLYFTIIWLPSHLSRPATWKNHSQTLSQSDDALELWYMPFCSGSDFTNMFHGNVLWSFGL